MAPRDTPRPQIIAPDSGPVPPFPLRMKGTVVKGFGRGSKELGIPTANIPVDNVPWIDSAESGVYFGWAGLCLPPTCKPVTPPSDTPFTTEPTNPPVPGPPREPTKKVSSPESKLSGLDLDVSSVVPAPKAAEGWSVFPMVMSIGYNPFYKNSVRSAEVHIMRSFSEDFYGCNIAISILGYIRSELDYVDLESLVNDINVDIEVAGRSLAREKWKEAAKDGFLWGEEEA